MTRLLAVCLTCVASVVLAKPPAPAAAPPVAAKPKGSDTTVAPDQVLAQMQKLYDGLEYDSIVPLGEGFVKRPDLSTKQRNEGYRLLASAIAITGDPFDAKPYFLALLSYDPTYDLPSNTPPKIFDVFKVVKKEYEEIDREKRALQVKKTIAGLSLVGDAPADPRGGKPVHFVFRLTDPAGDVKTMKLLYRKGGEKDYASLPFRQNEAGEWKASLPGEYTAGEGFKLEYLVETAGAVLNEPTVLLTDGTREVPKALTVAAGKVEAPPFKPIPKSLFFTSVGATIIVTAFATVFSALFFKDQAEYKRLANGTDTVEGSTLLKLSTSGTNYANLANGFWVGAGALAVVTGILIPFTKFVDDPQP